MAINFIYGTTGNDGTNIAGQSTDDYISGDAGNDTLDGSAGSDSLYGGTGDDRYIFGSGYGLDYASDWGWVTTNPINPRIDDYDNDTLVFKAGISSANVMSSITRAQYSGLVFAVSSTDKITVNGIDEIVFTDELLQDGTTKIWDADLEGIKVTSIGDQDVLDKDDYFYGNSDSAIDSMVGLEGNDYLSGGEADDTLDGGNGNDSLYGGDDRDSLIGAAGNDSLYGEAHNDILTGDDGDDYLEGGSGSDSLNGGAGKDVIYTDYSYSHSYGFSVDTVIGGAGNDTITANSDSIVQYSKGHEMDTIAGSGHGVLQLMNINKSEVSYSVLTDDTSLVLNFSGTTTDKITIGYGAIDEIHFADGSIQYINDVVITTNGNERDNSFSATPYTDIMNAGLGDDTISGGSYYGGSDTVIFAKGDGDDVISLTTATDETNTLKFTNVVASEISLAGVDGDVVITVTDAADGSQDEITITDGYGINEIQFSDGTVEKAADLEVTIDGTAGDDDLYGTGFADLIDGGAGNDIIMDTEANDTVLFGKGDGDDIIAGYGGTLEFIDALASEVSAHWSDEEDLVLEIAGTTDSVTLAYGSGIDEIVYSDGTVDDLYDLEVLNEGTDADEEIETTSFYDLIDTGAGDDTVTGSADGDTILFHKGDGDDTIDVDNSYSYEYNRLQFVDAASTEVSIARDGDDVTLSIANTEDSVTLVYGEGIDELGFSDGVVQYVDEIALATNGTSADDEIYATDFADVITGGTGNDHIINEGTYGSDTYVFNKGDGRDTVTGSIGSDDYTQTLQFKDALSTDISAALKGKDLVLSITGTTDSVTFENASLNSVDSILFSDGTDQELVDMVVATDGTAGADKIKATAFSDLIKAGTGNDTIINKTPAGDDTYVFSKGDGQDVIRGYEHSSEYTHTLKFTDVASSEISAALSGDNLVLSIAGTTDSITLKNFSGDGYIDEVVFANGKVWETFKTPITVNGSARNETVSGSDFNDSITGNDGNDTLYGYAGKDTLDGGAGNDLLYGGDEADVDHDTYLFGKGDGQDIIAEEYSYLEHNTLEFDADVAVSEVTYAQSGSDLVLSIAGTTDTVTIQSYFNDNDPSNDSNPVQEIAFADGTVWDSIAYTQADVTSLLGTEGDDVLNGGDTNDTLDGDRGADTLAGGNGNDTYVVDDKQDSVVELSNAGTDLVKSIINYALGANLEKLTLTGDSDLALNGTGNSLDNVLKGDIGDNVLDGKSGDDVMKGNDGDDTYIVDSKGDKVIEYTDRGTDSIESSVSQTELAKDVENLTLTGDKGIDGIGNVLDNILTGNSGSNELDGKAGIDVLKGAAGNDMLSGGLDDDLLFGGADVDFFIFADDSSTDVIEDFSVADDFIQLENSVFKKLSATGELKADNFVKGASALDSNDYVVYDKSAGVLYYDADGNGAGSAHEIAIIGSVNLTNADILVS